MICGHKEELDRRLIEIAKKTKKLNKAIELLKQWNEIDTDTLPKGVPCWNTYKFLEKVVVIE